jgi:hypothetical protein
MNVASGAQATEPASHDTAGQNEPDPEANGAAAGEDTGNSATADGDTAVSDNASSTAKSVKRLLKKVADVASAFRHDTAVGDSDAPRGDSVAHSTASTGAGANSAASTEKSGSESAQSEKQAAVTICAPRFSRG